jgi:GGDEF domain-containing protein
VRVTVSVGVSSAPAQYPQSDEDLIRLADQGMARAKADGGQAIVAVDPLDPAIVLRRETQANAL